MSRPTVGLLPSHPAQYWLMRPVGEAIREFAEPVWVLRDKDCLLDLAHADGLKFTVLSSAQRGLVRNATTLTADVFRAMRLQRRLGIDCWLTKYGAACIAARLTGRRSIAFNDDDADVVPLIAATAYPFANTILAPTVTRMGRYDRKTTRFDGNFELFYLHPNRFSPDRDVLARVGIDADRPYVLVRLSALTAHHDVGARGVSEQLLRRVIELADGRCRVFISSEKPLAAEFEAFRIPIAPESMHHALAFARLLIGDSQTMTSEAAVLGTPAVRISSFVGRLSYLDELERHGLAFGFQPGEEDGAFAKIREILESPVESSDIECCRQKFLADKGDPLPQFVKGIAEVLGRNH